MVVPRNALRHPEERQRREDLIPLIKFFANLRKCYTKKIKFVGFKTQNDAKYRLLLGQVPVHYGKVFL